jgi:hypothetical protein
MWQKSDETPRTIVIFVKAGHFHVMKVYKGVEVWLLSFLIMTLDGGEWSASSFNRFTPGRTTDNGL